MLLGEFQHNIDAKNRLFIPSQLRELLGQTFTLCKAPEGCLFAYSVEEWEKVIAPMYSGETTSQEDRRLQRKVNHGAVLVEVDKQGRVTVPKRMREFAQLEKEVTISGVGNRVEIWNTELWEKNFEDDDEAMPLLKF